MKFNESFPSKVFSMSQLKFVSFIFVLAFFGCNKETIDSLNQDSWLCLVEIDGTFEDVQLDEEPDYLNGGQEGFIDAVSDIILYPAEARENSIEGICIINYEIAIEGEVENVEAIQNPGGGIGESAVNSIKVVTEGTYRLAQAY